MHGRLRSDTCAWPIGAELRNVPVLYTFISFLDSNVHDLQPCGSLLYILTTALASYTIIYQRAVSKHPPDRIAETIFASIVLIVAVTLSSGVERRRFDRP